MKWLFAAVVVLSIASENASAPNRAESGLVNGVYSDSELGFRYVPPAQMRDVTLNDRAEMQRRAAVLHRSTVTDLLLAMSSGPDDTDPDWHSVGIETLSRASWPDVDDFHAETRMNASMARGALSVSENQRVTFSSQPFVATEFQLHEDSITKHAKVYTTIRRGRLISFAFSGNSPEQVDKMVETMKSLSFTGPN